MTDVLVVGGGPAGSMTALLLARRGHDVLVIDRAAFPRPKPCGDCLSAAATELLDRVGLLGRVLRAGASEIRRWDIVAPGGGLARGEFPDRPALALERRVLDALLLDAAIEAGARFRRAHVTGLEIGHAANAGRTAPGLTPLPGGGRVAGVVLRDDEVVRARLVVGADGLRSVVARELDAYRRTPRLRKISLTTHPAGSAAAGSAARTHPVAMDHGEMHVLEDGCIGFAPAGPSRFNLTLVVAESHGEALRAAGPDAFFRRWLARVPALHARFGDAELGELLASGPFDWPVRSPAYPGAALVGDAAGYYDPFTGQGVYQAMRGAELLAREVGPALEADRGADPVHMDVALRRYARAKARLTRPARRVQRLIEAVLSRPWLANPVMNRLAAAGPAMDRLIEVTGDLRPPGSLISPAVVSSLIFPPTPETE